MFLSRNSLLLYCCIGDVIDMPIDYDQLENMFKDDIFTLLPQCLSTVQRDYTIPRVPQWLSPPPNWVRPTPLPQASPLPRTSTRLRVRRWADPIRTIGEKAWYSVYSVVHCMSFCKPSLNALQGRIFSFCFFHIQNFLF